MGRDLHNLPGVLDPPPSDLARSSQSSSHTLWGIFTRKQRWGLSGRGWLLSASVMLLLGYFAIFNIHPFLAVTHRFNTPVLVVEGWVHRYAIRAGAEEFKNGAYEHIFTAGGPIEGGYINDYQTSASVGAEALKKAGILEDVIQMVPSHVNGRDRTYSSAAALRDWLQEHNVAVHSVNVLTEDCHARRTQLLYQKAFGQSVTVGIIAVANPDYDPKHWWRYSDGVREVIGESVAYIYAQFFFYPSQTRRDEKPAASPQVSD
jgi:DUF218 domain